MEEGQVAALLISDVQAHFAWFQIAVFLAILVLIIVSITLSIRAYAALSEARILYFRASRLTAASAENAPPRIATPIAINAAGRPKKIRAYRGRTLP